MLCELNGKDWYNLKITIKIYPKFDLILLFNEKTIICGESRLEPKKVCLKPVLLLHSPFLLPPCFRGGKIKRIRNNQ